MVVVTMKPSEVPSHLNELTQQDHSIILTFNCSKKKVIKHSWDKLESILRQGLEKNKSEIVTIKWISSDKSQSKLLLGLKDQNVGSNNDILIGSSIILGPFGGQDNQVAEEFRHFWGYKTCQLRRFEDGSIRETISLHNPWGPLYLSPAIVSHLVHIHFADQIEFELLHIKGDLVPNVYQTRDHIKKLRSVVSELSQFLILMSDSSLPLRQVRAVGSEQHCEGDQKGCYAPHISANSKIVSAKNGVLMLKKGANIAPSLTKAIPIMLDITRKKHLDQNMFKYLTTAFMISNKKKLEEKGLMCILKDLRLYVVFKDILFRLEVEPSVEIDAEGNVTNTKCVETLFQSMSMRYSAWAGTCHVIKKWLSFKMLEYSVPEEMIYLLMCHVFMSSGSPSLSLESAILKLFQFISFHDFKSEVVLIDEDGDISPSVITNVQRQMQESRETLPPIVILTPFDSCASSFTKNLDETSAKRMINLARQTLYSLISLNPEKILDWDSFASCFDCDLHEAYDIVLHLKPLQIPKIKETKSDQHEKTSLAFPIVDFDPVSCFMRELQESYSGLARFYYGKMAHPAIGVKLEQSTLDQIPTTSFKHAKGHFVQGNELIPNVEAMITDFKILGEGLVKEVECNIAI